MGIVNFLKRFMKRIDCRHDALALIEHRPEKKNELALQAVLRPKSAWNAGLEDVAVDARLGNDGNFQMRRTIRLEHLVRTIGATHDAGAQPHILTDQKFGKAQFESAHALAVWNILPRNEDMLQAKLVRKAAVEICHKHVRLDGSQQYVAGFCMCTQYGSGFWHPALELAPNDRIPRMPKICGGRRQCSVWFSYRMIYDLPALGFPFARENKKKIVLFFKEIEHSDVPLIYVGI